METRDRHLSMRVHASLHERLTRAARRDPHETRSSLATRLVDEGLRMDAHPGIIFRPGPAGRRPGVVAGPDVWEVARVLREVGGSTEQAIERTAEVTGLDLRRVRAAAGYYREFPVEIDAWIAEVDRQADEAAQQHTA